MAMKTINVSEATELQLDWLVAKCKGLKLHRNALLGGQIKEGWWASGYYMDPNNWIPLSLLNFSTDWAQGGPIIERKIHCLNWREVLDAPNESYWVAEIDGVCQEYGPTPLIAAMRCYVASKLGDTAEVPEELL